MGFQNNYLISHMIITKRQLQALFYSFIHCHNSVMSQIRILEGNILFS